MKKVGLQLNFEEEIGFKLSGRTYTLKALNEQKLQKNVSSISWHLRMGLRNCGK